MAKIKAAALYSGGLDSIVSIKMVQAQGIEVVALHFVARFIKPYANESTGPDPLDTAKRAGIDVHLIERNEQLLELIKNPRHGYGSNMNPCIDCRIQMLQMAGEYMKRIGARFLITGEVVGQRPMSQRRDAMRLVEKQSGLEGLLLRPLSAKLLEETIPEKEGWVDREALGDISGRSRKPQMALAAKYGILEYPSPAGGCLLTDPQFSYRVRDLMKHKDPYVNDMELLKAGRHLRLDAATKLVVGRNELDNLHLAGFARPGDAQIELADAAGPLALLRGELSEKNIATGASLVAHYSKSRNRDSVRVRVTIDGNDLLLDAAPAGADLARQLIIAER